MSARTRRKPFAVQNTAQTAEHHSPYPQDDLTPKLLRQIITSPTREHLTPQVVLSLQRQYGNQFVQRLVQRTLAENPNSHPVQISQEVPSSTIQRNGTPLENLPTDVLDNILSYLPNKDWLSLRKVSQKLRVKMSSPSRLWILLWEKNIQTEVMKKLANVRGMKASDKQSALNLSREETQQAAQLLIARLANPHRNAALTRTDVTGFETACFKGFAPPKDLHTFLMEITAVKSLMLSPASPITLKPGPESTSQGQEAPDYEYLPAPLLTMLPTPKRLTSGKGDNFEVSGIKVQQGQLETRPDPANDIMKKKMDEIYNTIINNINRKMGKYTNPDSPVIVTAEATDCPWLDFTVVKDHIGMGVPQNKNLQFIIVINGKSTQVWP